ALLLRAGQVPLSKYSYLTQTGLVALAGSLVVGPPATALALAGGVLGADWLWQKKMFLAALVNVGREVIALLGSYGAYAGALRLAYRGQIGRAERGEPTPDTAAVREHVAQTGAAVVIDDVTRDKRIADAPLVVQSLVMVPLKFGDQVIGTLELEHHKRKVY